MSESEEFTKLIENPVVKDVEKPEKKKAKKKVSPKSVKVSLINRNNFSVIYAYDSEEYQIGSRGKVLNLDENKIGLPLAKGLIIIKESF